MHFYLRGRYSDCRVLIDGVDADLVGRGFTGSCDKSCNPPQIRAILHCIINGGWKNLSLARIVLERKLGRILLNGELAEHENCITLDNRRFNLRVASGSQNQANRPASKRSTSGYKGVSWYRNRDKWQASIQKNGKKTNLGYFSDKVEAARAYDKAALEMFGEFARLNFPEA